MKNENKDAIEIHEVERALLVSDFRFLMLSSILLMLIGIQAYSPMPRWVGILFVLIGAISMFIAVNQHRKLLKRR